MARPRIHDPDAVLDVAESLAVRSGPAAVTIRAVATATGMSNGALYHTFGSRAEVLGRTWLRAAQRFLEIQTALVDAAFAEPEAPDAADEDSRDGGEGIGSRRAIEAVVVAATAPIVFAERFPDASKLLLTVQRDELLGAEPTALAEEIRATDRTLVGLMIRLARQLWGRADSGAVAVMTTCLVDLPTAILLRRNRLADPIAHEQLRAAVRAVLAVGPPAAASARGRA